MTQNTLTDWPNPVESCGKGASPFLENLPEVHHLSGSSSAAGDAYSESHANIQDLSPWIANRGQQRLEPYLCVPNSGGGGG
jgi:hypothetical protein